MRPGLRMLPSIAVMIPLVLTIVGKVPAQPAPSFKSEVEKSSSLSDAQKTARLSGHRNLFNGDCTFLFGDAFVSDPKAKYDKQTIHSFIDMLADSGVDTYICNTSGQIPWYPSKRLRSVLTGYKRGDREFFRGHFRPDYPKDRLNARMDEQAQFLNRYLDLAEEGVDWVAEVSKACRRRKISPWISIRMNDLHGANSWEKSYMNCDLQKDPRFRLPGHEVNPRDGIDVKLQALDYSHKEVRDYMKLMISEVVEDYDFEGLELDWLRCPFCLEPTASPEGITMMTQWTAEIREMTQARARKTGRPYPLGLRIPCRLGLLKDAGIDVKGMVKSGLIDFVGFSNFWQTSWDVPLDELRKELGGRVAILGVVEAAPNWMFGSDPVQKKQYYRLLPSSPELLRGNAAGKLALGVDGIETFNFFCADEPSHNLKAAERQARYPELRGLENLDHLRGRPKQYALATTSGYFMFPLFEYAEQVPAVLEPDGKHAFRISMCAEPENTNLDLVIQIIVDRTKTPPDLGVSFNGSWPNFHVEQTDRLLFPTGIYTHHIPEHVALNYRLKASAIREGWNEILVLNGNHKQATPAERQENSARIVGVELGVIPSP